MAWATIVKTFRFEAAHQLPNHDGKCARLHGHSYQVEVSIHGPVKPANGDPDEGMVLDFARVSEAWKPINADLDHRYLNDVMDFPTTAENIAGYLADRLGAALAPATDRGLVLGVKVYETATSSAEVRAGVGGPLGVSSAG